MQTWQLQEAKARLSEVIDLPEKKGPQMIRYSPAAEGTYKATQTAGSVIYALDTMIVSEVGKARPHGGVVAWFAATPIADYAIPAIVFLELQAGVEMTRRQHKERARELEIWIDLLEQNAAILPFDSAVARETAGLMTNQSRDLFEDAAIAATARIYGLTVVTRNPKDFLHFDVPQFDPFQFPRKTTA